MLVLVVRLGIFLFCKYIIVNFIIWSNEKILSISISILLSLCMYVNSCFVQNHSKFTVNHSMMLFVIQNRMHYKTNFKHCVQNRMHYKANFKYIKNWCSFQNRMLYNTRLLKTSLTAKNIHAKMPSNIMYLTTPKQ